MPPPAPSLSPARGSRTSPCSPFCPVYTTLFTDSRLHPAPSPTCGGGGVQGGQETELSAVSGTWPQRAPQSLNENGTNLNTLLVGWSPPPHTHTHSALGVLSGASSLLAGIRSLLHRRP